MTGKTHKEYGPQYVMERDGRAFMIVSFRYRSNEWYWFEYGCEEEGLDGPYTKAEAIAEIERVKFPAKSPTKLLRRKRHLPPPPIDYLKGA